MKMAWVAGSLLFVFAMVAVPASALTLGTAGGYNAFIFGDFAAQNSDIEGRLAAGGAVTLTNYGIGSYLPASNSNVLVVGGNLVFTNGQINNGNAVVGGSANLQGVNVKDGVLTDHASVPVDFAAEKSYLLNLSQSLSSTSANGQVDYRYGGIYLTGDGTSMLQAFNIDGSKLATANTFKFNNNNANMPDNATVVFNVSGASASMQNFGMLEFMQALGNSWDNVLFNFYDAESLSLSSIGVLGSILAPKATIQAGYGFVNGTVIADAWIGPMELHYDPFDESVPTPEPGTLLLLASGLVALIPVTRRMRAR